MSLLTNAKPAWRGCDSCVIWLLAAFSCGLPCPVLLSLPSATEIGEEQDRPIELISEHLVSSSRSRKDVNTRAILQRHWALALRPKAHSRQAASERLLFAHCPTLIPLRI